MWDFQKCVRYVRTQLGRQKARCDVGRASLCKYDSLSCFKCSNKLKSHGTVDPSLSTCPQLRQAHALQSEPGEGLSSGPNKHKSTASGLLAGIF
mmetsp:Transcript_4271/g.6729  ORF Transcript_4271/g.6729 Transcript_4271/m.6729 type:complete len:94 (-) Transcript_4271:139-420(-)